MTEYCERYKRAGKTWRFVVLMISLVTLSGASCPKQRVLKMSNLLEDARNCAANRPDRREIEDAADRIQTDANNARQRIADADEAIEQEKAVAEADAQSRKQIIQDAIDAADTAENEANEVVRLTTPPTPSSSARVGGGGSGSGSGIDYVGVEIVYCSTANYIAGLVQDAVSQASQADTSLQDALTVVRNRFADAEEKLEDARRFRDALINRGQQITPDAEQAIEDYETGLDKIRQDLNTTQWQADVAAQNVTDAQGHADAALDWARICLSTPNAAKSHKKNWLGHARVRVGDAVKKITEAAAYRKSAAILAGSVLDQIDTQIRVARLPRPSDSRTVLDQATQDASDAAVDLRKAEEEAMYLYKLACGLAAAMAVEVIRSDPLAGDDFFGSRRREEGPGSTPPPAGTTPAPGGTATLTVIWAGGGWGTVTSGLSEINCSHLGGTCQADFTIGDEVTLRAFPHPEFFFSHWVGCDRTEGNRCIVNMNGDRTVKVFIE